jgi:AcrR family transcriptional regulator
MAVARQAARRRVDAARREMYRKLVFEAAESVFAEHGFADAKMSDIALEAGIALKTLYSVFDGKLELYQEITRLRCEELLALVPADSDASPLAAVMEGVRAGVEYLLQHPSFLRTHLREGNAWAVRPVTHAPDAVEIWQENLRQQAQLIERGIDTGVFLDEDPELMTKMMTAVYQVHLADWLERGGDIDPAQLTQRIQRHIRHLLCGGDVPPGGDPE